jgi:hypothetical protein
LSKTALPDSARLSQPRHPTWNKLQSITGFFLQFSIIADIKTIQLLQGLDNQFWSFDSHHRPQGLSIYLEHLLHLCPNGAEMSGTAWRLG